MADIYRKAKSGERQSIPAQTWNALIDNLRQSGGRGGAPGAGVRPGNGVRHVMPPTMPQGMVMVKNASGSALGRYSVLGIDSVTVTPSTELATFQTQPVFSCITPTAAHRGKFVILADSLDSGTGFGEIGRAWADGVCVAKVNVTSADHEWADVKASDSTQLQSGFIGSARILYTPSGTGSLWCIVSLGRNTGPMLVTVENDGGDSGGDALSGGGYSDCDFTYTVKTLGGATIATAKTPQRARMSGIAYLAGGTGGRSTYGLIDLDSSGGVLLLDVFGEVPDPTDCP